MRGARPQWHLHNGKHPIKQDPLLLASLVAAAAVPQRQLTLFSADMLHLRPNNYANRPHTAQPSAKAKLKSKLKSLVTQRAIFVRGRYARRARAKEWRCEVMQITPLTWKWYDRLALFCCCDDCAFRSSRERPSFWFLALSWAQLMRACGFVGCQVPSARTAREWNCSHSPARRGPHTT